MRFDLGQVVTTTRAAHPVAVMLDDQWVDRPSEIPADSRGYVVGMKVVEGPTPPGVVVRFDGQPNGVVLMRPEDLQIASPLHARLAQGTEWMGQYTNVLSELWHVIATLKSLGFQIESKQQLAKYLQIHDNHFLQKAVASMSDADFAEAMAAVSGAEPSEDFLIEYGDRNEHPVKFEDQLPPAPAPQAPWTPEELAQDEEEEAEDQVRRLMGAGLSLFEFKAQEGTGEDLNLHQKDLLDAESQEALNLKEAQVDPLQEFLWKLKNAGFYMGNLAELQEMAAGSSHPGAQALQGLTNEDYRALWDSGAVDKVHRTKMNEYNKRQPQNPSTFEIGKEPAKMPSKMPAPEQAPIPGGKVHTEVNSNGNLVFGGQSVIIRPAGKKKPGATVKVNQEVFVKAPNVRGVGTVLGVDDAGQLVVMMEDGKQVAVPPVTAEGSMSGRGANLVVSMLDFVAQQMPTSAPTPTDPGGDAPEGPEAPPGSVVDYSGNQVNVGDYVEPAPGTPDQNMPDSQGIITEVKPDQSIVYTDDSGVSKVKDPNVPVQVIQQG